MEGGREFGEEVKRQFFDLRSNKPLGHYSLLMNQFFWDEIGRDIWLLVVQKIELYWKLLKGMI